MPAGDGTGPAGLGPMTGRAAGYCAGYPVPGFMNFIPRGGLGYGRFVSPYGRSPYLAPYGAAYAPGGIVPFAGYGRGFFFGGRGRGRGLGRGWGRGFGRGRGWW